MDGKKLLIPSITIFAILLAGMSFRVYEIGTQPLLVYEANIIQGARDYAEAGLLPSVMWWHPPLRDILTYFSTSALGFDTVGARFWSLVFGTLAVPLVAMLAYELFGDLRISFISAFFLAFDPLHITFSRQVIQETHVAFFSLLGVYLTVRYVKRDSLFSLALAGTAYGLGIASKWQAGFTLPVCWLLLVFPSMVAGEKVSMHPLFLRLTAGASMLAALPFAVYSLTYIPWLLRGYDLSEWLYLQRVMSQMVTTTVFDYEQNPGRAIDWFIRPSGYASMVITDRPNLTLGFNNLLVWWLVLPSFFYLGYRYKKERARSALFVSLLFWFSYLPLAAIPTRPIYLLTATSVIPFAFLGTGWMLVELKDHYKIGNGWVFGYLFAVSIAAVALFPLTCGKALDYPYLMPLLDRFNPH